MDETHLTHQKSDPSDPHCPGHPTHFQPWSGSSCSIESDIILKGFQQSEEMHGLWYLWLIGDEDSSVYHSVVTGVPLYGRDITKIECANDTVKCYRNRLEALCNDKPGYGSKHGLSQTMMKRITHGERCAIKMHSATGDVVVLHHDLHNGPRHCFSLHNNCNCILSAQIQSIIR